jgi:thioredoxin reductase
VAGVPPAAAGVSSVTRRGFDPKALAGKVPAAERRVEVLVIGAGPAGTAAAIEARAGGAEVLLVDENPVSAGLMGLDVPHYWGGRYTGAVQVKARMMEQVFAANPALEQAFEAGVEVELGVYCWGAWVPGYGLASLPEPLAGLADEERSWMVGFERLILATGARDVAFSFGGWNQPGVMGARALGTLLESYDAFSGRRLAILGSGELAIRTASLALSKGIEIAAMIELGDAAEGPLDEIAALAAAGAEILTSHVPVSAAGGANGVERLSVRDLTTGVERTLECDTVVQAVGLTPAIELLDVLGASLAMQPTLGGHAPVSADGTATSLAQVFIAGDVAGTPGGSALTPEDAEASGRRAAQVVLASFGRAPGPAPATRVASPVDAVARQQAWMRALMATTDPTVIVCQCEEVTREALLAVRQPAYLGPPPPALAARDLGRLLEDGPANQDQIKRLTRACMGPCQARRCREQVALILACASNESAERVPLAGYRAPVRPLPLSVLAAWDEDPVMAAHWDVWFGIKGQWTPYADIGTERESLYDNLLGGGDMHL